MSNNIEKLKKEAHFVQGELNPNFENIFKTLQEQGYLTENINVFEWQENIDFIIEELKSLEKNNRKIILKYLGKFDNDDFGERYLDEEEFNRILERKNRNINMDLDNLSNINRKLLLNIYKKEIVLNRFIRSDLLKNGIISGFTMGNLGKYYDKFSEILTYSKEELEEINTNLSKNFTNKYVILDITISVRELVKGLIGKIFILKGFYQKESFIEKFETRKKLKEKESEKYFLMGIFIFSSIVIGNIVMFWLNFDKSFGLVEFGKNFLGKNIYIFSIEIIGFILAFYFLWLFKVYKKVIELYDSHILLIESDDYYKNDAYFVASDSEKILEMRIENAQKIHDLPGKIFDIFNGKDSFSSELPVGKALDIINNLTKK